MFVDGGRSIIVALGWLVWYAVAMVLRRIDRAIVHGGQITVSGLSLPDGEQVQVVVSTAAVQQKRSILEVRQLLRGGVERYDEPFEPSAPAESWEMLQ
jgi:hypothetical protein